MGAGVLGLREIAACAGVTEVSWIPAFAGMTSEGRA